MMFSSRLTRTVLVVFVVHLIVLSESGASLDIPFQSFECYKDLCVDRLMFCHEREQRCKMCTRAYCLPSARTPEQCKPHCPELLRTTTTSTSTTTETSTRHLTRPTLSTGVPAHSTVDSKKLTDIEDPRIELSARVLVLAAVIVLLVIIVILGAATLHYVRSIRRQLRRSTPRSSRESVELEEGKALLPLDVLNPSVPSTAGDAHTISPVYTARPETNHPAGSTALVGAFPVSGGSTDNLRHHKGYDYHLAHPQEDQHCPPPYQYRQLQNQPLSNGVDNRPRAPCAFPDDTSPKSV